MRTLIVACLAVTVVVADLSLCPFGLDRRDLVYFEGQCFEYHLDELRTYDAAARTCLNNGGRLAMPKNARIQHVLASYLHTHQSYLEPVWIGLGDQASEGNYRWDDGTALTKHHGYTHWGGNQGHHHILLGGVFEDCVALNPSDNYKWHDYQCTDSIISGSHSYPFICQYDARRQEVTTHAPHLFTTDSGANEPFTTDSWSHGPHTTDSWSHKPHTTDTWNLPTTDSWNLPTTDSWSNEPHTTDSWSNEPHTTDSWSNEPHTTDSWNLPTTDSWSDGPPTSDSWNLQPQTTDGAQVAETTDSRVDSSTDAAAQTTMAFVEQPTTVTP